MHDQHTASIFELFMLLSQLYIYAHNECRHENTSCYATVHAAPKEQIPGNVASYTHRYDVPLE